MPEINREKKVSSPAEPNPGSETGAPGRLQSLDAYRGFVMLLMVSAGLGLAEVAKNFPESPVWKFLGYHTSHAEWAGCSFWDLIQPSFMFMVGVALPYSFASRRARGHSNLKILAHAIYRAVALIALSIFLCSHLSGYQDFTFVNVLAQIGLGYFFLFFLLGRGPRIQLAGALAILAVYWLLFALHPVPGPDFDYASVGARPGAETFPGLFAHWNKNTNFAAAADVRFLNLFPRLQPFRFNEGGYQTLNFVPSLATMIFGLMAGECLRGQRSRVAKFRRLALAGLICLVAGAIIGVVLCPIVKRIWTPSWTVYSAGWTLLMLAGFFLAIDILGFRRWAFPFVVVGMNSIAIYCLFQLAHIWYADTVKMHLGQTIFDGTYGPIWRWGSGLVLLWLACFWMYRRKIFLRI